MPKGLRSARALARNTACALGELQNTRMRRYKLTLAVALLLVLSVAAVAFAGPKVGARFTGPSAHKHYVVTVLPTCATAGCKKATSVIIQVTTGKPTRPNGKCPYVTNQLPNAVLKHGSFSSSGEFIIAGKDVTFKLTGKFAGDAVSGSVSGPKVCGGNDTYSVGIATAASTSAS